MPQHTFPYTCADVRVGMPNGFLQYFLCESTHGKDGFTVDMTPGEVYRVSEQRGGETVTTYLHATEDGVREVEESEVETLLKEKVA